MKAKTSNELISILKGKCDNRRIVIDMIPRESTQNTIYRCWEAIYEFDLNVQTSRILQLEEINRNLNGQIDIANESKPPIVELLTHLFIEKGLWSSTNLKAEVKKAGLSRNLLFNNPDVDALPISKFRATDDDAKDEGLEEGEVYWRAKKGWPN